MIAGLICTHCRGLFTAGCHVCNPPVVTEWYPTNPTQTHVSPLTDDEIMQLRKILSILNPEGDKV